MKRTIVLTGLVVVVMILATIAPALAIGIHPIGCFGQVALDGWPAPIGTVVEVYLGNTSTSTVTTEVGYYGPISLWGNEAQHSDELQYKVNGRWATKLGPDLGVFGWDNQEVDLVAITFVEHTWVFHAPGFYPKHLPDGYSGLVVTSELDTPPIEVQGVWWFDPIALEWIFWVPGVGGELTILTGQFHDYVVLVTGACEWEITLP